MKYTSKTLLERKKLQRVQVLNVFLTFFVQLQEFSDGTEIKRAETPILCCVDHFCSKFSFVVKKWKHNVSKFLVSEHFVIVVRALDFYWCGIRLKNLSTHQCLALRNFAHPDLVKWWWQKIFGRQNKTKWKETTTSNYSRQLEASYLTTAVAPT